jgi:hypothetical protein
MSQFLDAEPLDSGDDLFGMDVDFSAKPAVEEPVPEQTPEEHREEIREEMKGNAFAAIEDKLGLPLGSTKEGIKAAKETTKAVTQAVQNVKSQYSIIETKEQLNEALPVPRYNIESLAEDRERLRKLAFKNLDMANKWLETLDEQVMRTLEPTDQNWTAAANMYKTVSKGITDLTHMLVTLRQEDELMKLQLSANNAASSGTTGGGSDATGEAVDPSDPLGSTKGRPMTPQEVIALVREWGKERDAETEQLVKEEADARQRGLVAKPDEDAKPE